MKDASISGSMRALGGVAEGNRKLDQRRIVKRRTKEGSKASAKGGVDAMEKGHELCLCDIRTTKNPGEKGAWTVRQQSRHEHLQVRILQRLNFGGPFSSCSVIPPFCRPPGRFATSGVGGFWIVETIGDARSYVWLPMYDSSPIS